MFGGQYVKLSQLVQRCIKIGLHLPSEKSIAKIIADAILLGLASRTSTGHQPETIFLNMRLALEFNHDINFVWGQRNFVSLCLVCLASAFASERTSLILPIYQRYNLMLCCVFSCPSVDVNFSHLLLRFPSHSLM